MIFLRFSNENRISFPFLISRCCSSHTVGYTYGWTLGFPVPWGPAFPCRGALVYPVPFPRALENWLHCCLWVLVSVLPRGPSSPCHGALIFRSVGPSFYDAISLCRGALTSLLTWSTFPGAMEPWFPRALGLWFSVPWGSGSPGAVSPCRGALTLLSTCGIYYFPWCHGTLDTRAMGSWFSVPWGSGSSRCPFPVPLGTGFSPLPWSLGFAGAMRPWFPRCCMYTWFLGALGPRPQMIT